jgi:hypothetical protein
MALTPGTPFNQQNKVFRSAKALAQFCGEDVGQADVLGIIAENLADRVTIRPSAKRPENGPLIALTEFIPVQEEGAVQVKIVGGNAVEEMIEGDPALAPAEGVEVATPEQIMENLGNLALEAEEAGPVDIDEDDEIE